MHRSGSVVALDFLYNDGWRNESPGVTRVIGADAESIEKYRITVDAFTNSEHRVINIKEFLDIPEFTEDQIERAFDNGWGFVRCKTPFGEYHELLTSRDGSLQMVRTINVGLVYAVDPAVATDKPDEITISDFDKAREL